MRLRSVELATEVARLLNAANRGDLPPRVATNSPFRRYEAVSDADGCIRILRTETGVNTQGIALTDSRMLAAKAIDLLNRVDPHELRIVAPRRVAVRWWL